MIKIICFSANKNLATIENVSCHPKTSLYYNAAISALEFVFLDLVFTAHQDYFTHFELSQL